MYSQPAPYVPACMWSALAPPAPSLANPSRRLVLRAAVTPAVEVVSLLRRLLVQDEPCQSKAGFYLQEAGNCNAEAICAPSGGKGAAKKYHSAEVPKQILESKHSESKCSEFARNGPLWENLAEHS